jgi:hypothetical protein
MTITMYQASVPVFKRALVNLDAMLTKAVAYAEARKIEPSALLLARLAPDMYHLTRQVQTVCDTAKFTAAYLAGIEAPKNDDNETSFADLKARIGATVAFLDTIKPAQIDGAEERTITRKFGEQTFTFQALDYLLRFGLPNLYFHAMAAYTILRHNGLDIGKRDFLGES